VERRGGTIYAQTEVTGFQGGRPPRFPTSGGQVRARALVLAGEGYLSGLPGLRRQVLPFYSQIALTEPLWGSQWDEIGWTADQTISSMRPSVHYLARTADGRLLSGSRGPPTPAGLPPAVRSPSASAATEK
jgi:glycine/D-amino acid oxidase-like deaminating enzyme